MRAVGQDLEMSYILSGRMRQSGERLRVTTLLTETATGPQVWDEKLDRAQVDWFALQDDLTQSIVTSPQVQFIVNEGQAAARRAHARATPADLVAHLLKTRSVDDLVKAMGVSGISKSHREAIPRRHARQRRARQQPVRRSR